MAIRFIPNEGRKVRCPNTKRVIGPEGISVNQITTYWHRRMQSGDVSIQAEEEIKHAPKEERAEKLKVTKQKADKSVQSTDQGENSQ